MCSLSLRSPLVDSHWLVVLPLFGLMRCNTMVSVGKLSARMYQSRRNHSQSAASTRTQRAVKLDVHCAFESLPSIWCRECHPSEIYSTIREPCLIRIRTNCERNWWWVTNLWNTWLVDLREKHPCTQQRTSCNMGKYIGTALPFNSPSDLKALRWKCMEHTFMSSFGTKFVTFCRMVLHQASNVGLCVGTLKIRQKHFTRFKILDTSVWSIGAQQMQKWVNSLILTHEMWYFLCAMNSIGIVRYSTSAFSAFSILSFASFSIHNYEFTKKIWSSPPKNTHANNSRRRKLLIDVNVNFDINDLTAFGTNNRKTLFADGSIAVNSVDFQRKRKISLTSIRMIRPHEWHLFSLKFYMKNWNGFVWRLRRLNSLRRMCGQANDIVRWNRMNWNGYTANSLIS